MTCINIHCSGSLNFSSTPLTIHRNQTIHNKESRIWMTISQCLYMRMYADHCLKLTSYSSPSRWLSIFWSAEMKWIKLSWDFCSLDPQVKSRLRKILLIGLVTWSGLKHASKLLQCPEIYQDTKDLTNTSLLTTASSRRYLILWSPTICHFLENGVPNSMYSRSSLS